MIVRFSEVTQIVIWIYDLVLPSVYFLVEICSKVEGLILTALRMSTRIDWWIPEAFCNKVLITIRNEVVNYGKEIRKR